jgi:hypothetical protein
MLNAYWTGVLFGVGVTAFLTGTFVETGVLPEWPGVKVGLVRSVGAVIAAVAVIIAARIRQRQLREAAGGSPPM